MLQAAVGSQAAGAALAQLSGGLSAYTGYVGEATAEYAMGYPLTGGSFLQVASEEAHLVLLPAANERLHPGERRAQRGEQPGDRAADRIALLVLAVVTGFACYRAQRWLARRTNRVLSPGLVLASVLLAVSAIWLAAGFLAARSDLDRGIGAWLAPGAGPGARQHRRPADQGRRGAQRHLPQRQRLLPGRLPRHEQDDRPWTGHLARRRGRRAGKRRPGRRPSSRRPGGTRPPGTPPTARCTSSARRPTTPASGTLVVGAATGNTLTGYNALEVDIPQGDHRRPGRFRVRRRGRRQRARPARRGRDRRVPADGGGLRVGRQPPARGIPLSSLCYRIRGR